MNEAQAIQRNLPDFTGISPNNIIEVAQLQAQLVQILVATARLEAHEKQTGQQAAVQVQLTDPSRTMVVMPSGMIIPILKERGIQIVRQFKEVNLDIRPLLDDVGKQMEAEQRQNSQPANS